LINREVNTIETNDSITATFQRDEWLPSTGDHLITNYTTLYIFRLSWKTSRRSQTQNGYIIISISGTLLASWGLNEDELHKVLYKYGNCHIGDLISKGASIDRIELRLDSYNSPPKCPFDPKEINIIFNKPINILRHPSDKE